MSRAAEVMLAFGGEERLFRLPIGRLRAVQERCDAGPMEIIARLANGGWRLDDVREVILQGLIGGGLGQPEATRLMLTAFDSLPLQPFVPVAQAVMMAAVVGVEDEEPGEGQAGEGSTLSRAASSDSPVSTAAEASLV